MSQLNSLDPARAGSATGSTVRANSDSGSRWWIWLVCCVLPAGATGIIAARTTNLRTRRCAWRRRQIAGRWRAGIIPFLLLVDRAVCRSSVYFQRPLEPSSA